MDLLGSNIDLNTGMIHVKYALQRVSIESLENVDYKPIIIFERFKNSKSTLILKDPKTPESNRYVRLTKPLILDLKKRKADIARQKKYLGDEYKDYDLVFSYEDGKPIDMRIIARWFSNWQKTSELGFPKLEYKNLRHSSSTYKLLISNGDGKSVQAETGHSLAKMLYDTYAQIMDDNRKALNAAFEDDFYKNFPAKMQIEKNEVKRIDADNTAVLIENMKKDPLIFEKVLALLAECKN